MAAGAAETEAPRLAVAAVATEALRREGASQDEAGVAVWLVSPAEAVLSWMAVEAVWVLAAAEEQGRATVPVPALLPPATAQAPGAAHRRCAATGPAPARALARARGQALQHHCHAPVHHQWSLQWSSPQSSRQARRRQPSRWP